MATLGAAVCVQRQGSYPSGEKPPTISIVSVGRQLPARRFTPPAVRLSDLKSYFTEKGTVAMWFSQAKVMVPAEPRVPAMVYFRFSIVSAGLVIIIFVLPRS